MEDVMMNEMMADALYDELKEIRAGFFSMNDATQFVWDKMISKKNELFIEQAYLDDRDVASSIYFDIEEDIQYFLFDYDLDDVDFPLIANLLLVGRRP